MATYWGPANFAGRLRLDVTWTQSTAGNYSDLTLKLYYVGQWAASDNTNVDLSVAGVNIYSTYGWRSWGDGTTHIATGTRRVHHNSSGNASPVVAGSINMPFSIGRLGVSATVSLPRIPRQPSAPTTPTIDQFTATGFRSRFTAQGSISASQYQIQRSTTSNFTSATTQTFSSGGTNTHTGLTPATAYYLRARSGNSAGWSGWSGTRTTYTLPQANQPTLDTITPTGMRAIFGRTGGTAGGTSWELQYSTSSSFPSGSTTTIASSGTSTLTGLTPGTTYYVRARGKNSSGTGPWSATRSATTGTVDGPSISLTSDLSGTVATATLTPPPGVSVTSYAIEAEYLQPQPKPPGADKSLTVTTTNPTIPNMIPGATYRWRARAHVGGYTSPWSGWVTATQLNPNTLDQSYFDRWMTPDDPDASYMASSAHGITISAEQVRYPTLWEKEVHADWMVRRLPGSFEGSVGSQYFFRLKIRRPFSSATRVFQLRSLNSVPAFPVIPSAYHTLKIFARASAEIKVGFQIQWLNNGSQVALQSLPLQDLPTTGVVQLSEMVYAPENATHANVWIRAGNATIDTVVDFDGMFFAVGRPASYFDGNTPDTPRFKHTWEGDEWISVSRREHIVGAVEANPFDDPNCPAPPAAPRPPVPANDCIPTVTTWRRYWSPITTDDVSSALDTLPTFSITTGAFADGPARVLVFENPDDLSVEDFVPGEPLSVQVVTYLPENSEAVLDAVSERSYGRKLSDDGFRDIDHIVFGENGTPTTWPILRCGGNYMLALDVPAESPLDNVRLGVDLTLRMG